MAEEPRPKLEWAESLHSVVDVHWTHLLCTQSGVLLRHCEQVLPQWAAVDTVSTHVVPPHSDWLAGHMSAHRGMPSVRHPNMQDIIVDATQAPAPSHSAAVVADPAVQPAAAPQDVVLLGNVQAAR